MFFICDCPLCKGQFVEKIGIDCLETYLFEAEDNKAKQYILENVTIQTAPSDTEFVQNIRAVLKRTIPDEDLYNKVIQNLRSVFETRI